MVQTCCVGRTVDGNYNAYTVVAGVIARHHVFLFEHISSLITSVLLARRVTGLTP